MNAHGFAIGRMSVEKAQTRVRKRRDSSPIEQIIKSPPDGAVYFINCRSFYDAVLLLGGDKLAQEIDQEADDGHLSHSGWQVFFPVSPRTWDAIGSINWLFYDFRKNSLQVSCAFPQNLLKVRVSASLYCSLAAKLLLLRLNAIPFGNSVLSDDLIPNDGISAQQLMRLLILQDSLKNPQRCAALRTGKELTSLAALRRCLAARFSFYNLLIFDATAVVEQLLYLPKRFELVGFIKMPLCDFYRRFTSLPAFPSYNYQVLAQLRLEFAISSVSKSLGLDQVYEVHSSIMGHGCCLEKPEPSPFDVRFVDGYLRVAHAIVYSMEFYLYFKNVKAEAKFATALKKMQRLACKLAACVYCDSPEDNGRDSLGKQLQIIANLVDRANSCWNRVLLEDLVQM